MNKFQDSNESIMSCTNQKWKFWIAIAGILIVNIIMLIKLVASVPFSELNYELVILGIFLAFPSIFIQCPKCGSRWFWKQLNNLSAEIKIFDWVACPDCGSSCHDLHKITHSK